MRIFWAAFDSTTTRSAATRPAATPRPARVYREETHLIRFKPAWFPASTRLRSFEGTGRQGSDVLTPGQKPAKLLKLLNLYLENRLSVACVQSFFCVN